MKFFPLCAFIALSAEVLCGATPVCTVRVQSTLKSGEVSVQELRVPATTATKCASAARPYRHNFAPQVVAKKKVSHSFVPVDLK